jgi:hypothetical protein
MIWYLGLIICAVISFFLALRSMKDFQEDPEIKSTDYGLYLIRETRQLNDEILINLMQSLKGFICSLEKIQKGSSEAIVGFFPHFVVSQFPVLGLIEIEDYILGRGKTEADPFILSRQISLDDSFAWKLIPKKKQENLLKTNKIDIQLEDQQYLAWQVVFEPQDDKLQITPRVLVKDQDAHKKIELIKKVKNAIEQHTSLSSSTSLMHSGIYEEFKKRTLIPKQVNSFLIDPKDLKNFII